MGRLADKANLNTTTVSRMVHGRGVPKAHNVQAVADALGVDAGKVAQWVGVSWTDAPSQYAVPSAVNQLSRREQDAITELIKAMAAARKGVVGDASQRAASPMTTDTTTSPADTPTPEPAGSAPDPAAPSEPEQSPGTRGGGIQYGRRGGHGSSQTTDRPRRRGRQDGTI